ncbi:hypothetical protein Tco_0495540, partial [Tanacetum coccineum]
INFHGKVYWIRAKEVPGWVPELLEESDEEEQSIDGCMEGDNNNNDENNVGDKSDTSEIPETVFDKSSGQKCNTPKLGRSGIRVRGVLLQDQ